MRCRRAARRTTLIIAVVGLLALLGGHALGHGQHRLDHGAHESAHTGSDRGPHGSDGAALLGAACGFALVVIAACVRRRASRGESLWLFVSRHDRLNAGPEPPIPKVCLAL
jgi:hypothetical protein